MRSSCLGIASSENAALPARYASRIRILLRSWNTAAKKGDAGPEMPKREIGGRWDGNSSFSVYINNIVYIYMYMCIYIYIHVAIYVCVLDTYVYGYDITYMYIYIYILEHGQIKVELGS